MHDVVMLQKEERELEEIFAEILAMIDGHQLGLVLSPAPLHETSRQDEDEAVTVR